MFVSMHFFSQLVGVREMHADNLTPIPVYSQMQTQREDTSLTEATHKYIARICASSNFLVYHSMYILNSFKQTTLIFWRILTNICEICLILSGKANVIQKGVKCKTGETESSIIIL